MFTVLIRFQRWQKLWPYTHERFSLFRLICSHLLQQHGINSSIPPGPSNPYGLQIYIANILLIISTADSIEKILNLNQDPTQSTDGHAEPNASNGPTSSSAPILDSDGDPIWKVLVFDDMGRDVISSILRVNDLRAWGVTMHMYVKRKPFRQDL